MSQIASLVRIALWVIYGKGVLFCCTSQLPHVAEDLPLETSDSQATEISQCAVYSNWRIHRLVRSMQQIKSGSPGFAGPRSQVERGIRLQRGTRKTPALYPQPHAIPHCLLERAALGMIIHNKTSMCNESPVEDYG